MDDALDLAITLMDALQEEFCTYLGDFCQVLLPTLKYPVTEDLRMKFMKTWGHLTACARSGVEKQLIAGNVLQELVAEFLKRTVGEMATATDITDSNEPVCAVVRGQAAGAATVIEKAGQGALPKDAVRDVAMVVGQLLNRIESTDDDMADGKKQKKKAARLVTDSDEEDSDDDDVDDAVSPQMVRFALADVLSALMSTSPAEFDEVALPTYIQLVQKLLASTGNTCDQSLAFYIADGIVAALGDGSVKYWNCFMNQALVAVLHKAPVVRQYATKVVGNGARQKAYAQMAPAAATSVFQVLQKSGQKYKRRRATGSQVVVAIAVEACIKALGQICEHHGLTLGEHAEKAWSMWLTCLPLRYDTEAAQCVHAQLLRLLAQEHPAIVAGANLPKVVALLIDLHKTPVSTSDLDKDIVAAMSRIGAEKLTVLGTGFTDAQKKKVETMLKSSAAVGA
jgi:hypothetical protein